MRNPGFWDQQPYQIDPMSANIPGVLPDRGAGRFGTVEQFRFEDGQALDCKGYPSERQCEIRYAGGLKRAQVKGFAPAVAELIWVQVRVAQARLDPREVEP
jgi:hypothetical protein